MTEKVVTVRVNEDLMTEAGACAAAAVTGVLVSYSEGVIPSRAIVEAALQLYIEKLNRDAADGEEDDS